MFERRPVLGLLIGLTLCIYMAIWRFSMQESSMLATEGSYPSQNQFQPQGLHYHGQSHQELPAMSSALNGNVFSSRGQNGQSENANRLNTIPYNNYGHINSSNSYVKLNNNSLGVGSYYQQSAVNYDVLPKDDLSTLIDLNNFEFIMNQRPCPANRGSGKGSTIKDISSTKLDSSDLNEMEELNPPLVLILIHSAPANYKKRLLIRETWGSLVNSQSRIIFLLGTVNSTKEQQRLERENRMFSDMVQGNFVDAYRNMTYKHVMAFKWFTYYCPDTKFILKADDDVFVNMPYLINYLSTTAERKDLIFCQKAFWSRVKRSYRSKWRVSAKEYPGRYYPPYCPGYAIIYTPDVAFRLYQEAQNSPYFWIDDVHITGTLSKQANISLTSFEPFMLKVDDFRPLLSGKNNFNGYRFLFSWPDILEDQIRQLWEIVDQNLR